MKIAGANGTVGVQRFAVGAGAWLEYAPEPLYPHRETDYAQHTRLELAAGASALFTDQLAPGRVATR